MPTTEKNLEETESPFKMKNIKELEWPKNIHVYSKLEGLFLQQKGQTVSIFFKVFIQYWKLYSHQANE